MGLVGAETNEMPIAQAAEPAVIYQINTREMRKIKRAALILHDVGSKQKHKEWVEQFKAGEIVMLFVYNMQLTGFDAKRLKRLCRHPQEFDTTNKAYCEELRAELDDEQKERLRSTRKALAANFDQQNPQFVSL